MMLNTDVITRIIRETWPETQAIYLFGSFAEASQHAESDVDIAVLLPPESTNALAFRDLIRVQIKLEEALGATVELIDLRNVSTVFQKEIIFTGRRLYVKSQDEVDAFEILVMALYQKLNDERAEIIRSGMESGFYPV